MSKTDLIVGPVLITLCGGLLVMQVLLRPAVGLSNNGDFAKMAGAIGLGPEEGNWISHKQYGEFVYRYVRDNRYWYNSGLPTAEFLSSEFLFVKLARGVQRVLEPGPRFDIRWLGAIHGMFFLLAIGMWLQGLAARWRLYAGPLVVFIWTDVAYVQYLNTFYMDSAAMIFLILFAAAGTRAVQHPGSSVYPPLMVCAGILFTVSKPQHAIPGLIFIALFLWFAVTNREWLMRAVWIAGAILLAAGASLVIERAAPHRGTPLFSTVFSRIVPIAPDRVRALEELGLGKNDLPYVGVNAYAANGPMFDPVWVRQFNLRCSYASILRYYLRHPSVPAYLLYHDLSAEASQIQPWGNLSPEDGFKADARAQRFVWWTNFRGFLFRSAPWHMIVLALVTLSCAAWVMNSPRNRALGALALAIQLVAIAEYGIAVLADAEETNRHLILFHVSTDISILLLPLLISRIQIRRWRFALTHRA